MLQPEQIEELIVLVSAMDRQSIMRRMREFRGSFPVDFTNEFLERQPIERLQHIFIAMCIQNSRSPVDMPSAA